MMIDKQPWIQTIITIFVIYSLQEQQVVQQISPRSKCEKSGCGFKIKLRIIASLCKGVCHYMNTQLNIKQKQLDFQRFRGNIQQSIDKFKTDVSVSTF
ncbi:unnamed protein product [Paramecium octaurelia]|uniref:Uncharacterized protein n=1 Tax=Paramecium octaurelia TaxID=43137 RepID=A0A8S1SJB4_PAROT|nr:unnamed protein product [Paramecium octaurelia]